MMENYINKISQFLDFQANPSRVLYLHGTFGVGKSHILDIAKKDLPSDDNLIIFDYDHRHEIEYFHEFVYNLFASQIKKELPARCETFENRNNFLNLLNNSYSLQKEMHHLIKKRNKLRNVPGFLARENSDLSVPNLAEKYELSQSDSSLLFEPERFAAESFLIDLLATNYNFSNSDQIELPTQPKNIIFIIDNYDKIAGSVNDWICNILLDKIYNQKLSEFKFYEITNFPEDAKAADFFDFKFLLAGRERFNCNIEYKCFNSLFIEKLRDPLVLKLLEESNIDASENLEAICQITQSLPFLVNLLADTLLQNNGSVDDLSALEDEALKRAINYLDISELSYLKSAAFFDDISAEALSFAPLIKDDAELAYKFIEASSEFSENSETDKVRIKPAFATLLKNSVWKTNPMLAENLETIAELYDTYADLMQNFLPEERETIRHLAFFKNFDRIFAIQEYFGDKAAGVRKIIDKYPTLFFDLTYSIRIEPDIAAFILQFEKATDPQNYSKHKEKVKEIWQTYVSQLDSDLAKIKISFKEISDNIEELEKQDKISIEQMKREKIEQNESQIESNLIKGSIDIYKIDNNIAWWALPLGISLLMVYLKITFEAFSHGVSNSFFVFFVLLLFSFSGYRLFKFIKSKKRKNEHLTEVVRLNELEKRFVSSESLVNSLKLKREIGIESLRKYKEIITRLEAEIHSIKMKLKEPFVREG